MAISRMAKIIIACHKSQVSDLLEALQQSGACQILNAEQAMVSKAYPDLRPAGERPKEIADKLNQISQSLDFLKQYADKSKGLSAVLAPKAVINQEQYEEITKSTQAYDIIEKSNHLKSEINRIESEIDNIQEKLDYLRPWSRLDINVEELRTMEKASCLAGLLPANKLTEIKEKLDEAGAVVETIGQAGTQLSCLVVCLNENKSDIQKLLRSADFEAVSFEGMNGTVEELTKQHTKELSEKQSALKEEQQKARELAKDFLKIKILFDHHSNLFERETTGNDCPATEQTVILEGWARKKDTVKLEKIVSKFETAQLNEIEPAEGEQPPVEIENKGLIKPFEVVTRLYGMPETYSIDPTAFLAPFFALFFGLCLTDAGYGILMLIFIGLLIWKMQGDKKLMWMLIGCSLLTIIAGALTGGWFGDAIQQYLPVLEPVRQKMIWFDPLEKPMKFFKLSLILGYIQIMAGLLIGFFHNLRNRNFAAAVIDKLCWIVFLNAIVTVIFVGGDLGRISGYVALIPAALILLFSHREGGIVARLGMGLYSLFSSIFYMGDVLSYLRLMALGMVTAGMAMAINAIAGVAIDLLPYGIGIVAAIFILIIGHIVNMAFNALGAFVHTLRLQYAEFFPKFFVGGGKEYKPLCKNYKYVQINADV